MINVQDKTRVAIVKALKAATPGGTVTLLESGKIKVEGLMDLEVLLSNLQPRPGYAFTPEQADIVRDVVDYYPGRKMSLLDVWREIRGYGSPTQGAFRDDPRGWTTKKNTRRRLEQPMIGMILRDLHAKGAIRAEFHDSGRLARVSSLKVAT